MNFRSSLLPLLVLPALSLHAQEPSQSVWDIEASVGVGLASYEERLSITPVVSDWEAPTGTVRLKTTYTGFPFDVYGSFRFTSSATDTEEWRESGLIIQQNDLSYVGTDLRLGVSYPVVEQEGLVVSPRVGVAYTFSNYERNNFTFLAGESALFTISQEVDEEVTTYGPSVGVKIWKSFGERFSLQFDTEVFWATFSEADNSGFDIEIEGDGGLTWTGELVFFYDMNTPDHHMGISLSASIQDLDGDSLVRDDVRFEWPDSKLEQLFLEFFYLAKF